jgi:two-component system, chemotaxis family, protein-glutamate methylesterase/glutaminase
MKGHNIIVVGTSAGGLEALDSLIQQLPVDLPAAVFIVQHLAADSTAGALLSRLSGQTRIKCKIAVNEENFQPGSVYIAPADRHLLVKKDYVLVTKGARENRYRPGIDPLFRSAAATHGAHVIGVLLTGMLDDGTAGLIAVKRCGGVAVVQDPTDAAYPEMPQNALNSLEVDHSVPVSEMGGLLQRIVTEKPKNRKRIPEDIRTEALIAERVLSDVRQVGGLGEQVPYNCPNCGGVLWEIGEDPPKRYRCHTGHSFTAAALLTSQTERIEETLWVSLRMFEERKNLLNNMARTSGASLKRSYLEKVKEAELHVQRIREMLHTEQPEARQQ